MTYVLTNGKYYIKMTDTGAIVKTDQIDDARIYLTIDKAKERMVKSPGKTKGYYILDIGTHSRYYISKGRIKFPKEIREMLYRNADGKETWWESKVENHTQNIGENDREVNRIIKKFAIARKWVWKN